MSPTRTLSFYIRVIYNLHDEMLNNHIENGKEVFDKIDQENWKLAEKIGTVKGEFIALGYMCVGFVIGTVIKNAKH